MNNKKIICLLLLYFISNCVLAITPGKWQGTFTNSKDKRYKIHYVVTRDCDAEVTKTSIRMVNIDLEPTPDYTYQLQKIKVDNGALSFDIPRKFDTRSCELSEQEDKSYIGSCLSDKGEKNQTSHITMKPIELMADTCDVQNEDS